MSKAEIYYFSGTGNSLYAAKELQRNIPECELIPILGALRNSTFESKAEIAGFVLPNYVRTIPGPVRKFLKKINLKTASYVFAVVTAGGSPSTVCKDINKIISGKGKQLNAYFELEMPNNSLIFHGEDTPEEIKRLVTGAGKKLGSIQKTILNRGKNIDQSSESNSIKEKILFSILGKLVVPLFGEKMISFYSDSNCSSCGICEKVCLSGKIAIKDRKPEWQKNVKCMYCFACINFCPVQSIQIKKSKTNVLGRYHHPEITAKEIAGQKLI